MASPHILMTGGGTLGPVTPLIAIVDAWKLHDPGLRVSWIGTPRGPERELIERRHETFYDLSAPKLSRHAWWQWPYIGPLFAISLVRSFLYLREIQPDMVFSAGGYVSVPVAIVAKLLGIPVWVHQLDVVPGIANKLMAPFATQLSVTWEESMDAFPARKTMVVGGMLRKEVEGGNKQAFMKRHGLRDTLPTLFVLGGGTGATQLNQAMEVLARELLKKMNIVHLTGMGKMIPSLEEMGAGYVVTEFMDEEMKDAYATADVVVARAGMGTIFEVAGLVKPTILVPIKGSHQEANARVMEERGATKVMWHFTPQLLKQEIEKLMNNPADRRALGEAVKRAVTTRGTERIVERAIALITKERP